jgi:hypothetical protein
MNLVAAAVFTVALPVFVFPAAIGLAMRCGLPLQAGVLFTALDIIWFILSVTAGWRAGFFTAFAGIAVTTIGAAVLTVRRVRAEPALRRKSGAR